MLDHIGLTAGEALLVGIIAFFIVSARYWPRCGAWLAERIHLRLVARRASPPR